VALTIQIAYSEFEKSGVMFFLQYRIAYGENISHNAPFRNVRVQVSAETNIIIENTA
jgi:hypothetical protein